MSTSPLRALLATGRPEDAKLYKATVEQAFERAAGRLDACAAILGISRDTLKAWLREPVFADVKRLGPGRIKGSKRKVHVTSKKGLRT